MHLAQLGPGVVTAERQYGMDVYFTIPTAEGSSLGKGGY